MDSLTQAISLTMKPPHVQCDGITPTSSPCPYWTVYKEFVRTRDLCQIPSTDPSYQVTSRMKALVERIIRGGKNLSLDFHRYSGRAVVSVLMVKPKSSSEPAFFEGINTEVAIQSGSICAERCSFAAARAAHPDLSSNDLIAVACVYVPLMKDEPEPTKNPSWPCGVCMEWYRRLCGKSEIFRFIAYPSTKCETVIERFLNLRSIETVPRLDVTPSMTECQVCSCMRPETVLDCPLCERLSNGGNRTRSGSNSNSSLIMESPSSFGNNKIRKDLLKQQQQ